MSQYLSEHEPQNEPATGYRSRGKMTALTLGTTLVAILILTALLAPWLAPFDPNLQHIEMRRAPGEIRCALLCAGQRVIVFLNRTVGGEAFGVAEEGIRQF